ncbi:hypothetical protein MTP99_007375 [Tenebrio molitor]|nr:hypothetical protein MTP99_007375 [Tenebrio molitor]
MSCGRRCILWLLERGIGKKAWCVVMVSPESPIKRSRRNHGILRNRWDPVEKVQTLGSGFSCSQVAVWFEVLTVIST